MRSQELGELRGHYATQLTQTDRHRRCRVACANLSHCLTTYNTHTLQQRNTSALKPIPICKCCTYLTNIMQGASPLLAVRNLILDRWVCDDDVFRHCSAVELTFRPLALRQRSYAPSSPEGRLPQGCPQCFHACCTFGTASLASFATTPATLDQLCI